jgi:hypothetical protein
MSKQLMNLVLPRLARPLYRQLQRYRAGELNDRQFTRGFEALLQRQHTWLAERGVSEVRAALAIHGAVLVLSGPGLRAEAEETGLPLEVIEFRAVCEAATDVARTYGMSERKAIRVISRIVARYGT